MRNLHTEIDNIATYYNAWMLGHARLEGADDSFLRLWGMITPPERELLLQNCRVHAAATDMNVAHADPFAEANRRVQLAVDAIRSVMDELQPQATGLELPTEQQLALLKDLLRVLRGIHETVEVMHEIEPAPLTAEEAEERVRLSLELNADVIIPF